MCLYIDDKLVCGTVEELNNFRIHMEKYFGNMDGSKIDDLAYLGMHVTIIDGRGELRSDSYCKKLM